MSVILTTTTQITTTIENITDEMGGIKSELIFCPVLGTNFPAKQLRIITVFIDTIGKGRLSYGFARARCVCGTDLIIAFSCKRRGFCPSCNTKHMIATATHFIESVLAKLPLRQWVLSVPKWIRYYLARDASLASQVLRIFIDEIKKQLLN